MISDTERAWQDCLFPLTGTSSKELLREVLDKGASWDLRKCSSALIDRPILLIMGERPGWRSPPGKSQEL